METVNNNPATKKQRFALWLASKSCGEPKDFRTMELTVSQAAKLLQEYNERTGYNKPTEKQPVNKEEKYKKEFIKFFKEKYLGQAVARVHKVLQQASEVYETDAFGNDLGGKRYKMYGCCAVGWLEFRRCKKYELIYKVARGAFNHECMELVHASIDKKIIKRLEREGCPIGAITGQDYSFREMENDCISHFLQLNGAKEVRQVVHID